MSSISIIKLYDLLTIKVDKETAGNQTLYVEEKIRDEFNKKLPMLATKENIANTKTEIIKWLFAFWVGQIATTFSIILYFLKN
jgi:hypothetical protein